MKLQPQAKKDSKIAVTFGAAGVPKIIGDGTAKAVVSGEVVDNNNNHIGYLDDIAQKSVGGYYRTTAVPPRASLPFIHLQQCYL